MPEDSPIWAWAEYSDVGSVIELEALYDDNLKKVDQFTTWAIFLANRIIEDFGLSCKATYGKWGARLEPKENPDYDRKQLELAATLISNHQSWKALKLSTRVFTYGNRREETE